MSIFKFIVWLEAHIFLVKHEHTALVLFNFR